MNAALFVVSTGRCGTQWLAAMVKRFAGDAAVATHEPLEHDYPIRQMLGARDLHRLDPDLAEPLNEHVGFIEQTLRSKPYIECGHPSWSSIPFLVERFRGRVKIVHLVRHPVQTAFSWLTHFAYCPPPASYLPEKILVSPFDEGVRYPSYRERWASMTPYEKALYYWLEVNALVLDVAESDDVPSLRIRYEDLFRGGVLDRFLAFAGLPARNHDDGAERKQVDEFRYGSPVWCDPRLIDRHPDVISLASRLGYDTTAIDEEALRRRYLTIS